MVKKKVAELELKILGYLWELNNKSTVQEIIDKWREKEKPGYTTILKKLQIMEKKELVCHEKSGKAYVYIPMVSRKEVSRSRFDELLKSVFSSNKVEFAHAFFDDSNLTVKELQDIKKMIEDKEREVISGDS